LRAAPFKRSTDEVTVAMLLVGRHAGSRSVGLQQREGTQRLDVLLRDACRLGALTGQVGMRLQMRLKFRHRQHTACQYQEGQQCFDQRDTALSVCTASREGQR
jgi:hypothetical protein